MPKDLKVFSRDEKVNVSLETWAAFSGEGVPTQQSILAPEVNDVSRRDGEIRPTDMSAPRPRRRRRGPAPKVLTGEQVHDMLANTAEWRLRVKYDATEGVLERRDLNKAWSEERTKVLLRDLTADDAALIKSVEDVAPPSAGLKDVLALPLTSVATFVAAVGGFGLAAATIEIAQPLLAIAAVILLLFAIGASLVGQYAKKTVMVKRARLDLLEAGLKPSRSQKALPWVIIVVLFAAIVCAVGAVFPPDDTDAPSASIENPDSTTTAGGGREATVTIAWKNLPQNVTRVRTTVASDGIEPVVRFAQKSADGTASRTFEVELPGPTTIEVTTEALDGADDVVGTGRTKSFEIP